MPAVEARAPHPEEQVVRVKLAARLPAVPVLEAVELPAADRVVRAAARLAVGR